MILLIDNYDSFVFNLARTFRELGQEVEVRRNDSVSTESVREQSPAAVVLSPGPGTPQAAGICVSLVRDLSGSIPILGVCLGHQAIAVAFGGRVRRSGCPAHGVASAIHHDGRGVFLDLPPVFEAGRYHSLIVDEESLPDALEVSARTADGTVMGIRHRDHPTVGLQFHPESILSPGGPAILTNFLAGAGLLTRRGEMEFRREVS